MPEITLDDKIKLILKKRDELQNELLAYENKFEKTLDIVDGIIHENYDNHEGDIYDTFSCYVSKKYILEEKLATIDMILHIVDNDEDSINKYLDEVLSNVNENYSNLIKLKNDLFAMRNTTSDLKIKKNELLYKLQEIIPNN